MSDNSRVRVSIIGVVIVALFCSLLARLWFLQMGPEQKLKQEAIALATRTVQTASPRGSILDRNGKVLVQDRVAWAATVDRTLKPKVRDRVLSQLSELLAVDEPTLQANYASPRQSQLLPAVVKLDLTTDQRLAILEHTADYPGVHIQQLTVRSYPEADLLKDQNFAAQLLGYVGEVSKDRLKTLQARGYQAGDVIGQAGVESAYESALHGVPQIEQLQVDPTGRQIGPPTITQPGSIGNNLWLTIDANIQHAAEVALNNGLDAAHRSSDSKGMLKAPAGSVVVLDAHDGSVVAMASNPSYPPSGWANGISQADFNALQDPANHKPLLNRVTQGLYAPGSTFKLVTSLAETRFGIRGAYQYYDDTGSITVGGDKRSFHNDQYAANGSIALARAITVSSDTYFYSAGNEFWQTWNAGDEGRGLGIQQQARELGFGAKTGFELDEVAGVVPDPKWQRDTANKLYKDPAQRRDYGTWNPGQEINLAVGQGELLVTPLQVANAYACFANGGTLPTPHIGMKITAADGKVVNQIAPKPRAQVAIDPTVRSVMMDGFVGAVQGKGGTATAAFSGSPIQSQIAGKTGTAQVDQKQPTSVFAAMYPVSNPQYIVVAFVEEGGHGAQISGPIVRQILETIAGVPNPAPIVASQGND